MTKKKVILNRPRFSFTPAPPEPRPKVKARKKKPSKNKVPKPIVPEHVTKTAARAVRKNREDCFKQGVNPEKTNPLRPVTESFVPIEPRPRFAPGLNDLTAHTIANLVRNGFYNAGAAELSGVSGGTLAKWLGIGRKRRREIDDWRFRAEQLIGNGEDEDMILKSLGECPETTRHVQFLEKIEHAKAEGHNNLFGKVWIAATEKGDIETAKWLLERMYPALYGKYAQRLAEKAANGELTENDPVDPGKELQRRLAEMFERSRSKSSA